MNIIVPLKDKQERPLALGGFELLRAEWQKKNEHHPPPTPRLHS